MRELRVWYRDRLPARIAALEAARTALEAREPEALESLRRIAHMLHGSGATYGFPEISEAARRLENAPEDGLLEPARALVQTLRTVMESESEERSKVLIVEDDPDLAHFLEVLLAGPNRKIVLAHSGAQALAILERHEVSLILLDLILPDTDGRNLLARLRERVATAAIPILVTTVKSAAQARVECLALGADDYFEKPVDPDLLRNAVSGRLRAGSGGTREFRRDPLTGLPNRAAFHEAFDRAQYVATVAQEPLSLAKIDIDRFELVTESCGASVADQVLRRAAAVIARTLRASDLVARWSGEEFAVLLPRTEAPGAVVALNQALLELKKESFPAGEGRSMQISFSAGVTAVQEGMSAEDALAEAERHLYRAKLAGLDRVVSCQEEVDAPARKVLLAEDDEMIRLVIRRLLEREGYEVTTCDNGSAALRCAYENTYSMILSDVKMPQLDGFELLQRLRELPGMERTPVVMLTSMGKDQDVHRGFELGADDYIVKPFSSAELMSRIRRLMKKAS